MAVLLKTKGIASQLEDLIVNAKSYICIFTYNMIADGIYIERLKSASRRGVKITVVIGVNSINSESLSRISAISNCTVYFKERMHAKFYYNEDKLIISTMNLSEFSERNNYEIGLLFLRKSNPEIFDQIKLEARDIIDNATVITPAETVRKGKDGQKDRGFCVRCNRSIAFDIHKPLCYDCYEEWAIYFNKGYLENFCHKCGERTRGITFSRPECIGCSDGINS